MLDGIYRNPTVVFFGKDIELQVGSEVKKYADKVLLLYGQSSFKRYGLYDRVTKSLETNGVNYIELGGVKPNPTADLVYKGISICRNSDIDFILAVGGGSVIDTAKAIGIGIYYDGDFWDFYERKATPQKSAKVGVILTVPGAGSETGEGSVITNEKLKKKSDCASPVMYPVFAFMNPEVTFTLSFRQTATGIVDAISHVLERYFSNTEYVDCTDRICEGLIKTLMKYALLVKEHPTNYDIRAEIMWACKLAHDSTPGFGRKQDWACHKIAHEIGVLTDAPHGMILSVVFPAWMEYVSKINKHKFVQFAERVFDIDLNSTDEDNAIEIAIEKFRNFLKSIEMPSSIRELGINDESLLYEVAERCSRIYPSKTIGNYVRLSYEDVVNILKLTL